MARGAFRGAAAAWLGLIALQAVTTDRGSQATGGALSWVTSVVNRALSPDVAAIPNLAVTTPADAAPAASAQDMRNPYLAAANAAAAPTGVPRAGHYVAQ